MVLIGTVFLVQSQVYGRQLQRSGAHDNARTATETVAAELRSTVAGGIVVARPDSLVVRSPMVMPAVCAAGGSYAYVQVEGGLAGIDTGEFGGVAAPDPGTGAWNFLNVPWSTVYAGTTGAAAACAANGADTVGASSQFLRLRAPPGYEAYVPTPGSVMMFFRQTSYRFRTSTMDPGSVALFRRAYNGTALEFVTGMDPSAAFSYRRRGQSGYQTSVTGSSLLSIDAVRIVAEARKPSASGSLEDVMFGWSVVIPVRNVR